MPLPSGWGSSACQLGLHFRASGGLGEAAEPSFSHRIHTEMSETARQGGHTITSAEGQPLPWESQHRAQQGWELGMEQRKFFNSVTDLENVNVHPRHSWGLSLTVANAEGNASVLPQARIGHSTCTHRYRGQSNIPGFSQQHRTVSTFVPCGQQSIS